MIDLNLYGSVASLIGLIVSVFAYFAAVSAKKAAQKVQDSFLFDRRIPQHLKFLDEKISKYNELLSDINNNKNQIKTNLAQVKSELNSLLEKVANKSAVSIIQNTIKSIDKISKQEIYKENDQIAIWNKIVYFFKSFYLTSHSDLWKVYTNLNEIYTKIDNLKLDKKYLIK